ncbi:MAG: hypothetical protein ABI045_07230 [Flavobacteriales bacterium]
MTVVSVVKLAAAILIESGLSFLGIGAQTLYTFLGEHHQGAHYPYLILGNCSVCSDL